MRTAPAAAAGSTTRPAGIAEPRAASQSCPQSDTPRSVIVTQTEPTEPTGCVVCQRAGRIPHRPPVCEGCRTKLAGWLREIPALYARLDPQPSKTGGEKVSGSRTPPVPPDLDVVDLTSPARPGSSAVKWSGRWAALGGDPDQIGHLPVATVLDFWVRDWIANDWCPGDHLPLPVVATLAGWLETRVDTACDYHPSIDEFAADIRRIHTTLRHH